MKKKGGLKAAKIAAAGAGILSLGSLKIFRKVAARNDDAVKVGDGPYWDQYREGMEILVDRDSEKVKIVAEDGTVLKANLYPLNDHNKRVVIACHGYHSGCYKDMAKYTPMYLDNELDMLFIMQRVHEESDGEYITFGVKEKRDVICWCKKVIEIYGEDVDIILHGVSMGAATVLMAAGEEDLPENVRAIVADCGYSSIAEELADVMKKYPKFAVKMMDSMMERKGRRYAGISYHEASPAEAVKNAKVPALLIHGEADAFVPFKMLAPIVENYAGPKTVFTVPKAGHVQSYTYDKEGYERRFKELLHRTMTQELCNE